MFLHDIHNVEWASFEQDPQELRLAPLTMAECLIQYHGTVHLLEAGFPYIQILRQLSAASSFFEVTETMLNHFRTSRKH